MTGNVVDFSQFAPDSQPEPDISKEPDRFAADRDLSNATGLPLDYVERNRDEAENIRKKSVDFSKYADTTVGASLSDPNFSNLAQDDLDNLSYIEKMFKGLGTTISESFKQGVKGIALSAYEEGPRSSASAMMPSVYDPYVSDIFDERAGNGLMQDVRQSGVDQLIESIKSNDEVMKSVTPQGLDMFQKGVRSGIQSLAMMAPGIAASIATKSSSPMLSIMGAQTYGDSYGRARSSGLDPEASARYGLIDAAIEVGTEKIPADKLLDVAKTFGKDTFGNVIKFLVAEGTTEQIATFAQSMNAYLFGLDEELENAKTLEEKAAIQAERQAVTFIATVVAGGAQAGIAAGAGKILNPQVEQVKEMVNTAQQSNLKRRSPEDFRSFLQAVDPLSNIFIPASALEGVEIEATNPTMKSVKDQLRMAKSLNGDVVVPVSDVVTDIPPEVFDAVYPYMRVNADGVAEIEDRPDMKDLIEEVNRDADNQKQAKAFRDNLTGMLTGTARVTPDEAKKYSAMVSARIETLAIDKGMTFDEAVQTYVGDLKVVGPDVAVGDGAIMDQPVKFTSPESAQTGSQVTVAYARNKESAKNYPQDMDFGRDIEPAGEYIVIQDSDMSSNNVDNWEYGTVTFNNPLVLEHKNTTSTGWKKDLSDMFGGKTGKALTAAINKAGYDGIITKEVIRGKEYYSESVNLSGKKNQEKQYNQPVYHGTPHRFDKFSLDAMGTGEGLQAFGWGLYFAGNKSVADYYKSAISHKDAVRQFREVLPDDAGFSEVVEMADAGEFDAKKTAVIKALDANDWLGFDYPAQAISAAFNDLQSYDPSPELVDAIQNYGNIYKVDAPEDSELLAWDKTLNDQPESVTDALKKSEHYETLANPVSSIDGQPTGVVPTGRQFYQSLSKLLGSDKAASEHLDSLGIPGLRFLDGSSRGKADGNYNYVIWDENRITIEAINDEAKQAQEYAQSRGSIDIAKFSPDSLNLFSRLSSAFRESFSDKRLDKSIFTKPLMYGSSGNAKSLSDLVKGDTSIPKEYSFLGEPSFVSMLSEVARAVSVNPEVLDSVVSLVPVDVVDNLFGSEGAAKMALHNEPMLKNSFAFDADLPVSGFGDTPLPVALLVFEAARMAAKLPSVPLGSGREPIKSYSALKTDVIGHKNPRALISISDSSITIKLFESSNLSSFLHEAGHLFLEIESRIARMDGVSESQQKMLDWLGVKSFEEIGVEQHEKFARGFEAYAMEGRAPSADLVEVFRSFARWLKKVYSSIKQLDVELNDDIRQFFDRMLAADQAIKDVERLNQYYALFKDAKTAGMTEAEYADYQANLARANSRGNENLQSKLLKELTRQTEKWWKEELKSETEKAMESIGEQPIYRAARFMSGDMLDDPRYGGFDKYKMDAAATKAILGDGVRIPEQLRGMTEKGGLHPDEVAALFDFASGQDMIQQITSAPTLKQASYTAAQAAMIEKHGDILNDGTLQQEADISAHNEERGKLILSELRALNRKTGADTINRDALKYSAKEVIGRTPLKDIHPGKYRTAEVRSAKQAATALAKKDYKAASDAKLKQAANFYLYREALEAKRKEQSWRRYLKSVQDRKYSAKEVNPDYVRQMKMLAAVYDFRKSGNTSELLGVAQWLKAQQEVKDADYAPQILDTNLSAALEAAANGDPVTVKHYREMTMDELQGVYDMVKHLRWVGGQMSENEKAKFQAECQATAENIAKFGGKIKEVPREETKRHRALSGLRQFLQDHLALANQIEELDGFEKFGPMFEMVYKDVIDSSNTELKFRRETAEKMRSIFEGFGHSDFAEGKDERTIKTEAGNDFTLSRRGRVMFALYWGSPESREALMTGDNLTVNDANKMLSFMTGKELDLVEKIWELNESFWPRLAEVSRKMTGIVPAKVEHVPYAVGKRVMKGGYMRLYYDYDQRDSWQAVGAEDAKITRSGARLVTQTKHGSRNERVGSGGRKVSMSVNNIFRAMDEVIHDISFAETARKVTRVMANKDVSGAIINHYGKEKYESINSSLEGIIAGNVSNSHPINAFIRHFRTAATYSMLGYSLRNLIQQPVAVTNMFGKIGEVPVIAAMGDFVMNRNKWGKFVQDRSEFMRNRTSLVNREVAEIMASVGGNVMSNKLKQHAFDMQTMGDAMIAYPGWLAAYRQGLKRFGDEAKAVVFADEAISATIGSGLMKDMSPLLQGSGRLAQTVGPEMLKTITFMGSYFNVIGRLIRDANKQADFKTIKGVAEYTRQMTWYLAAPAILSALLVGQGPDDDENWFSWVTKTVASYGMASVFMVRDLVSVFSGYSPSTSYTRALESIGRAANTVSGIVEGEKDITDPEELAKALRATSYLYPLPGAGQAARTLEYIGSQESGNEGDFNIYKAIVVGKDRD